MSDDRVSDESSSERRIGARRDISLPVVAGGSVRCLLLDVSQGGARLSSRRRLPEMFYLLLRPDLKRWCQVIWRQGNQVGVNFIIDPRASRDTQNE